jgi:glycosyltransferase involved in cell wall biosynthesis
LRSARAVVANSPGLKALSEASDPFPVFMIPNGVDSSFFVPPQGQRPKNQSLRLLFAGRFQEQKNLSWLLDQLAEVRNEKGEVFTLELVGDGPLRGQLEAKVRDLHLSGIVQFRGWIGRPALREAFQVADLIINPSHYEGMPNVVLEAMACGRPVLASRVPGNDTLVIDGTTGWLFSLGDAAGFRSRVLGILCHPEILAPLGAAGRARAAREFSWQNTSQSYLDLLAEPSPTRPRA